MSSIGISYSEICLRYTRDSDATEDMVQETFLRIAEALDRFRGDSEVEPGCTGWP